MTQIKRSRLIVMLMVSSLFVLVSNYQACSPTNFGTQKKINESLPLQGNGDSYPGKVNYYISSDSNNPCNRLSSLGHPFPKREIFASNGSYSLVRENCQDIKPVALDPSLIQVDSTNQTLIYQGTQFSMQADLREFNQVPVICSSGQSPDLGTGNLFASPLDLAAPIWQQHPEISGVLDGSLEALPNYRIEVTDPSKLEDWRRVSQDAVLGPNTSYVVSFLLKSGTSNFASISYNELPAGQFVVIVDLVNASAYVQWQQGSSTPIITSVQRYGSGVAVSVAFTSSSTMNGPGGDIGVAPFRPNNNDLYAVGDSIYATAASIYQCR